MGGCQEHSSSNGRACPTQSARSAWRRAARGFVPPLACSRIRRQLGVEDISRRPIDGTTPSALGGADSRPGPLAAPCVRGSAFPRHLPLSLWTGGLPIVLRAGRNLEVVPLPFHRQGDPPPPQRPR